MKNTFTLIVIFLTSCATDKAKTPELTFAPEIVRFKSYANNPVFKGTGTATWDEHIRERGYILREDSIYHLWYTGHRDTVGATLYLGYATSSDGLVFERHEANPIFTESWVEDMMVVKRDSLYYMFAEGRNDIAHWLTSKDRVHWIDHGSLDIRYVNGDTLSPGPYGTPTVWAENSLWYLFYERNDEGIWLATSKDLTTWVHIQDEPVIAKGPEAYDKFGVAMNQIVKHDGIYYGYYHGTAFEDWHEWSTNVAASTDLIHWTKYAANPIMKENKSSGILVADGNKYRLYTMHPEVAVHFFDRFATADLSRLYRNVRQAF
jgi:beta-1,2-mannobiose phosphorylase / 1,2-beta-oligomannan phosphorylase